MSSLKTLRIALIGCGFIGRRHLENVRAMKNVILEAVADVREEAASVFLEEFGARYSTSEALRIFEDRNIDAVVICTHHDSHAQLALQAAAAGKHILLEKPMALSTEECYDIAAGAAQAGVVLSVNFKFRFAPAVLKAREFIERPIITLGQLSMERLPRDHWVRDPTRGGGLVLATACHALDMIYWLNRSEPVRVYAEASPQRPEQGCNVDAVAATVSFANGSVASLLLADAGENPYAGKWLHEVFDGKRSALLYDHFRQVRFSGGEPGHYASADDLRADGTYGLLDDFLNCIRTGTRPLVTARDGVRAALLGIQLLESLKSSQPQEVRIDGLD